MKRRLKHNKDAIIVGTISGIILFALKENFNINRNCNNRNILN